MGEGFFTATRVDEIRKGKESKRNVTATIDSVQTPKYNSNLVHIVLCLFMLAIGNAVPIDYLPFKCVIILAKVGLFYKTYHAIHQCGLESFVEWALPDCCKRGLGNIGRFKKWNEKDARKSDELFDP